MSSFDFSLQPLLDLRTRHEDEARVRLAESQQEAAARRQRLQELQEAYLQAVTGSTPAEGEPVRPAVLLNNDMHLARLRLLAAVQEDAVSQSDTREQADRHRVLAAACDRRIVERLRERRRDEHLARLQSHENRALDEAATQAFNRHRTDAA